MNDLENIILASGSPRRSEILQKNHVKFQVIVSSVEENYPSVFSKEQIAMFLAFKKALEVETQCKKGIIIAADTIVYLNEVLGKPTHQEEAVYMLNKLSGKIHEVITGVSVMRVNSYDRVIFYDITKVTFKKLNKKAISDYIDSGEIWDKAGAYAIQGKGVELIEKIEGDYYNVVGLPFEKLKLVLEKRFNVKL